MEFEDALHRFVAAQAPLATLLGEPTRLRFFKGKIPQGSKMPALVQQRAGGPREKNQCGEVGAVPLSMQIDAYAKDWASMAALAKQFRLALDSTNVQFPIWMGEETTDSPPLIGVRVKSATLEQDFDRDDPDPGLLVRTQLWTFWILEDTPAVQG